VYTEPEVQKHLREGGWFGQGGGCILTRGAPWSFGKRIKENGVWVIKLNEKPTPFLYEKEAITNLKHHIQKQRLDHYNSVLQILRE